MSDFPEAIAGAIIGTSLLGAARLYAARHTVAQTIALADDVADRVRVLRFLMGPADTVETTRRVARTLESVSRYVPGALCLHRAAAGRVWLATSGISSRIVIGVHRGASWQGHAWLEVEDNDDTIVIFSEEVPFRPVFGGRG